MSTLTLEERVEFLEAEVRQLKQHGELDKSDEAIPWWKRMVGIYADSPEFEEAVRFGKEWRATEDPTDNEDVS